MSTSHETILPHATLGGIIDNARDNGTPRKAFAIAADASEEMVRRWESGQLPKLRPFKRMVSRHNLLPDPIKQQMLDWLLRGTGWKAVACETPGCEELDATGDGKVDGKDTLLHAIRGASETGRVMEMLADAMNDGQLSEAEKAEVRPVLHGIREAVERAVLTLDFSKGLRAAQ